MPVKPRRLRRRSSTPNLIPLPSALLHHILTADPTSPPDSPTTSPQLSRKLSLKPRHQPPFHEYPKSLANDPNIKPVGDGHQFSYQPKLGPEQLSPRDSDDDSSEEDDDLADDESESVASVRNPSTARQSLENSTSSLRLVPASPEENEEDDEEEEEEEKEDEEENEEGVEQGPSKMPAAAAFFHFTLEELDPMDDDWDHLSVLHPYEVEPARSRSSSWHKDALDLTMMRDLKNLNCSASPSSSDTDMDSPPDFSLDEEAFLKRQQELRRIRRVSMSSSVGKRTHSELSDSDSDDRLGPLGVDEVGSSARRMRKRLHRTSLLFHDPPEQIEELEEPDSEDERGRGNELCKELPYWTMEIMEVDSS